MYITQTLNLSSEIRTVALKVSVWGSRLRSVITENQLPKKEFENEMLLWRAVHKEPAW